MVGVSELMGEKEIIFPEMAALTIGMWIVDKKVWTVSRLKLVLLMSIGAIVGVCIVRYSPFPLIVNLCISFAFSAICLQVSRTTLIPQISACMLPILLAFGMWQDYFVAPYRRLPDSFGRRDKNIGERNHTNSSTQTSGKHGIPEIRSVPASECI